MASATGHRGTLGTPDHHYPGAARCQTRRLFGCRSLRISEYRLGLIILLVRPQEDRPKGQKLFHGGLLWSVANVLSVPSGANTKIASPHGLPSFPSVVTKRFPNRSKARPTGNWTLVKAAGPTKTLGTPAGVNLDLKTRKDPKARVGPAPPPKGPVGPRRLGKISFSAHTEPTPGLPVH